MVVTKNELILLQKEINAEFKRLQDQIDALKAKPKTTKKVTP